MKTKFNRREFLKRTFKIGFASISVSGLFFYFHNKEKLEEKILKFPDFKKNLKINPNMVIIKGKDIGKIVEIGFKSMGGIENFFKKGETILLKPNMAWDRSPEQGANTNPYLIAEVAKQFLKNGAKKVIIADVPCNEKNKVLERSGILREGRAVGAEVLVPENSVLTAFEGKTIDKFEVGDIFLKADRIINMPVVKVHSLAGITCTMKNWYGVLMGRRNRLHQDIYQSVVDLTAAVKSTLCIIDATRIMVSNGPTGGSLSDVVEKNIVVFTTDEVAGDAWATEILGKSISSNPAISLAKAKGIGTDNYKDILKETINFEA